MVVFIWLLLSLILLRGYGHITTDNLLLTTKIKFKPQNQLERTLLNFFDKTISITTFHQRLLTSQIYVLGIAYETGDDEPSTDVEIALKEINIDGKRAIPAFSSLKRIREFSTQAEHYLQLTGESLLETIADGTINVHLNPGSNYNYKLTASDITGIIKQHAS